MRTVLLISLLVLASLSLSACGGSKIAVLDPSRVYQESEAGKAALAHLEAVQQDVQKKAESAQAYVPKAAKNNEVAMGLQHFFLAAQEAMGQAQQETINRMQELVQTSITAYREKNNIAAVFQKESLISMDQSIDITDKVIELMNQTPLSFTPVQLEEFTPPASPRK